MSKRLCGCCRERRMRATCPVDRNVCARISAPRGPLAAKPRSSASASAGPMPRRWIASAPSGPTAVPLMVRLGVVSRSRTSTPAPPILSSIASRSPTGPAPTTTTSMGLFMDLVCWIPDAGARMHYPAPLPSSTPESWRAEDPRPTAVAGRNSSLGWTSAPLGFTHVSEAPERSSLTIRRSPRDPWPG